MIKRCTALARSLLSKSMYRRADRIEFYTLIFGCFAAVGILQFAEQRASESQLLAHYLEPIMRHQRLFLLAISAVVYVFLFKKKSRAKAEVRCRIIVGDTITRLRLRHFSESLIMVCVIAVPYLYISFISKLWPENAFGLTVIFIGYIALTTLTVR